MVTCKLFGFRAKYAGFPGREQHGVVPAYTDAQAQEQVKEQSDQILWVHTWETPLTVTGETIDTAPVTIYQKVG